MEIQPVDLTALVAMSLSILVILIPITGVTMRFVAKPLVEALLQSGLLAPRGSVQDAELARLSRRVLELEQQVASRLPPMLEAPTELRSVSRSTM